MESKNVEDARLSGKDDKFLDENDGFHPTSSEGWRKIDSAGLDNSELL